MSAEPLRTQADLIRASGAFDRSTRVRRLFDYLLDCTLQDKIPKEIDIALHAMTGAPRLTQHRMRPFASASTSYVVCWTIITRASDPSSVRE
jgi:hypothetical protein